MALHTRHQRRGQFTAVFLAVCIGVVWFSGHQEKAAAKTIGHDRIVAWEALPEVTGDSCEFPVSATPPGRAAVLQAVPQQGGGTGAATDDTQGAASQQARAEAVALGEIIDRSLAARRVIAPERLV